MRGSLRRTLLAGLVVLQTLVLAGVAVTVYVHSSELAHAALRSDLELRARTIADGIEIDPDGLEFEMEPMLAAEFDPGNATAFAVVIDATGKEQVRSPSLQEHGLPPLGTWSAGAIEYAEKDVGSAAVPCAVVTYSFLARTEHADDDTSPGWTPPSEAERQFRASVAMDRRPRDGALASLVAFLAAVSGVTLLVTLLAGAVLARIVLRPIEHMTEAADRLDAQNPGVRLAPADTVVELRRLAKRLNEAFDRLSGALDKERRFVADASHELRTPVSILLGNADLLLRRRRTEAEYVEGLELQQKVAGRMRQLVDDLLLAARAGSVGAGAQFTAVLVPDLLDALAAEHAGIARERGVEFTVSATPGLTLRCEPEGFGRIVRNLASNALKFTPAGGRVAVSASITGNRCRIDVADTGPGVTPIERERIFQRFHRAVKSSDGTGLGLAIVRALVEAHGGRVHVEDAPPGGALFVVELPGARIAVPEDSADSARAVAI